MENPTKVKIGEKYYKINTDFRVGLECNKIAQDENISDYERALAIIYKLFGDEGLNDIENHMKLLELGQKYLQMGKDMSDVKKGKYEQPDFDYEEDYDYIVASFMYDYHIDLNNTKMHLWTFWNLLNGLSNSEFGSCCILSRIRNLRNYDTSQIKDPKERKKMEEMKEQFALKKNKPKMTEEQRKNQNEFLELLNRRKGE